MTCRCPICGKNNAGRAGAKSFAGYAAGAGWRDEHGRSPECGFDRRKERRLRRTREGRAWRNDWSV